MSGHEEFVELCALYTAGGLPDEQVKKLDCHLAGCLDCRRVLEEFQEIASMGLPALAPDFAALPADGDSSWMAGRTEQRLVARMENEVRARALRAAVALRQPVANPEYPSGWLRNMRHVRALPYAAAVFLIVSTSIYSYHLGAKQITSQSKPKLNQAVSRAESLQRELAQLSNDRASLNSKLQDSERTISALSTEVKLRMAKIASLKDQEKRLADAAKGDEADRIASESDRGVLSRKLVEVQASLDSMQRRLDTARDERTAELVRIASLEKRLNEATTGLKDRDQTIQQQQELLAHDRDIRDLIGARDLYIAEVTDVGRDAETQAPFARVFFTKGKSLIFYGYDLDKQPGVRRAGIFQAWGLRGPDLADALPLGILYLDNSSENRRWVLKFDDPKALAKIDAVFVTVEPKAGSRKPSGKPLLFAYLRVEANFP